MNKTLLGGIIFAALATTGASAPNPQSPTEITVAAPVEATQTTVQAAPEESNLRPANTTEIDCLARNVYFEARGEGRNGMRAVAHVTMNRVESRKFRNTVCGVVYQPSQFSWTIRGGGRPGGSSWSQSRDIARDVYTKADDNDNTGGATYFHARGSRPSWSFRFTRTAVIGNHSFYVGT